jgi:hypothetical protein
MNPSSSPAELAVTVLFLLMVAPQQKHPFCFMPRSAVVQALYRVAADR